MKRKGQPIAVLTGYDAPTAKAEEAADAGHRVNSLGRTCPASGAYSRSGVKVQRRLTVFCRNVLVYFGGETQERALRVDFASVKARMAFAFRSASAAPGTAKPAHSARLGATRPPPLTRKSEFPQDRKSELDFKCLDQRPAAVTQAPDGIWQVTAPDGSMLATCATNAEDARPCGSCGGRARRIIDQYRENRKSKWKPFQRALA
jgi:hypothetical protein